LIFLSKGTNQVLYENYSETNSDIQEDAILSPEAKDDVDIVDDGRGKRMRRRRTQFTQVNDHIL